MITAFLALLYANAPLVGVGLFALAGLANGVHLVMVAALMVGVGLGSFITAPLREWLSLEQIYHVSATYPLTVLAPVTE